MFRKLLTAALVLGIGVGLTVLFWRTIWEGGGFIGGDLYPYFLPQKQFYQESLHDGQIPYWNDRVAHGYPQLAESQTGVFYPTHPVLYRWLDLNRAYGADHLLHYVIAFCGMVLFARTVGLSLNAGLLAGLVYVYGWFPSRVSLEWAIIGGAWTPWLMWCTERFLTTRRWRFGIGLSAIVAVQLLGGHFNLCFISLLLVAGYAAARVLWFPGHRRQPAPQDEVATGRRGRLLLGVGAAVFAGFLLAAIQLLPTWELKGRSQRSAREGEYSIAYGNLPPEYLSELVLQLKWFVEGAYRDEILSQMSWMNMGAGTNLAEAHLYFGLVPLLLIVLGIFVARRDSVLSARERLFWWLAAIAAIVYAFGWLLPVTQYLPGFSFFQGPGRFTLIAAFAGAILAGDAADRLRHVVLGSAAPLFWSAVFLLTAGDLWLIGLDATYCVQLETPPIKYVDLSPVAKVLQEENQNTIVRLYGPGQNVPTLLGVSAVPQYLGIGPKEYFDPKLRMPEPQEEPPGIGPLPVDEPLVAWLQQAGVTHILSFRQLDNDWPVGLVFDEVDPFLNGVWARGEQDPIYLYRLDGTRGRAFAVDANDETTFDRTEHSPTRQVWSVTTPVENTFVITELIYPGWNVNVDGQPAEPQRIEGMYRGVTIPEGKHEVEWIYRPASVVWGRWISLGMFLLLAAVAHVRFWYPGRLRWLEVDASANEENRAA